MIKSLLKDYPLNIYIFLFIGILIVRLLIFRGYLINRHVYLYSDNAVYAILAQRFYQGDFYNAIHPYWNPGLPLLTALFYAVFHNMEFAQIYVSIFSIIALLITIFLFFKSYSYLLAVIITFVGAFSIGLQKLVIYEGITEPLYLFLLWTAIFCSFLSLKYEDYIYELLTGLFFGLTYLTRTDVMPIFMLYLFLKFLKIVGLTALFRIQKETQEKKRGYILSTLISCFKNTWKLKYQSLFKLLLRLGVVILTFLIINAPYVIVQSTHLGRFVISGKYAYFGSGPPYAQEKGRYSTWAQDVFSVDFPNYQSPYYDSATASLSLWKSYSNGSMTQSFSKLVSESLKLYKSENSDNFFAGFSLIFTIAGFIIGLGLRKFRFLTLYLFICWLIGFCWVNLFMAALYRYLAFAFGFFFYLEGLTIYSIFLLTKKFLKIIAHLPEKSILSNLSYLPVVIILIIYFRQNMDYQVIFNPPYHTQNQDNKKIGEWIKKAGIKLYGGRMEAISYYSGAKLVYMPSSTPENIVDYMKAWGVEYLLVRPLEVGYDFVRPISKPNFNHPDLTLYKQFDDGSLIWKIALTNEERKNNERTRIGYR